MHLSFSFSLNFPILYCNVSLRGATIPVLAPLLPVLAAPELAAAKCARRPKRDRQNHINAAHRGGTPPQQPARPGTEPLLSLPCQWR